MQIRTDLAIEICHDILSHNSKAEGIECKKGLCGPMVSEEVHIQNEKGEKLTGKPAGRYLTLNTGKLWLDDRELFREKVLAFREFLAPLLERHLKGNGSVLVVGLGNRSITADAVGPAAVKSLLVTRHLRVERPAIFEDLGLWNVCAITPGVLGQTGIESAHIVKGVTEHIKPEAIIVIDALASRDLDRLVSTIQISDTGLCPGSGIGNGRPALNERELGVPVISIGTPTVVDAATLAADAIRQFTGDDLDAEEIRREWSRNPLNFFVTPKETDQIINVMGTFIGYGINLALNRSLTFEDMLTLVG
ncbi:MAG: GPR endopeptidase [Clostridia bacterium]|nr:GPR endopeptidase [Clostridia bacterium]